MFVLKAEVDGQKKQTPVEVIKALQQFIEGSTLGEFDARLELLQAFHCQVTHMDQSEEQGEFKRYLFLLTIFGLLRIQFA